MTRFAAAVAVSFLVLLVARETCAEALPPLPEPRLVQAYNSVTIGPGGRFDIGNSGEIIRTDPLRTQFSNINGYVVSGRNGYDQNGLTNWNGSGIISNWARSGNVAAGYDRYGVGVVSNGDFSAIGIESPKPASFWGASVTGPDSVFFWATYNGDANLDGTVDDTDYLYWVAGNSGSTGVTGWLAGDFNYDGVTDVRDLAILQANGVPEPSSFVLLGMGTIGLLAFARRRRKA